MGNHVLDLRRPKEVVINFRQATTDESDFETISQRDESLSFLLGFFLRALVVTGCHLVVHNMMGLT